MPSRHEPQTAVPFPDEVAALSAMRRKLEDALEDAQAAVLDMDKEYTDTKRYMAEYRGELDPHEMFQNERLLSQTDRTGVIAVRRRDTLAKLTESPYFARIDFQRKGTEDSTPLYIGRFAFLHDNQLLIYDWRAPIAGMFYDYELGPAGYDAPMGRIEGELTRKRQFKIANGVMEYALESSAHIQDEILQKELSRNSDEKMKSIIATLQKEQNRIIRNEKAETLLIQGVAGSGKTSIALHRVAFLLYRLKDKLTARDVTILSPNKVFADYISGVIPELGEEPVREMSLSDIAHAGLDGVMAFWPDSDPLEPRDEKWAERVRFKSTPAFAAQMKAYIQRLPERIFAPVDAAFGPCTVSGEWIRERFRAYDKHSIMRRLGFIAQDLLRRMEAESLGMQEVPKRSAVCKVLTQMLTLKSASALYKDFYRFIGRPELFVLAAPKTLEWADVFPFLFLKDAFEGIGETDGAKHLVIDEMQDYTPIQHAVIRRLFPCPKTILGDFGQFLNPRHLHTLQDIRRLYPEAEYVELNKSYRSTREIMAFAARAGQISSLEVVERHGEEPLLVPCAHEGDEILHLRKAIRAFQAGGNASLGIILKTNRAAEALAKLLCGEEGVHLISPESTAFAGGVTVTSIQMAKGLEFDEVLIPQANALNYSTPYDRNLLYIACTRAMHRLTLFYTGEPSPLLSPVCPETNCPGRFHQTKASDSALPR